MFRPNLSVSAIAVAAMVPSLAFADTITGQARVDTVTIYPGQATVSRQIVLDMPAGRHDVVIPGLPANLNAQGLRVSAAADAQIGAVNLARGRLPVTDDQTSPEVEAAETAVEAAEEVLRQSAAAIAEIRLRAEAANEQIAFLQSLSQASAGETLTSSTIADIQALAQMVGAETLAARQTAFAAEQEAKAAERAREDELEVLREAKQALAALLAPPEDGTVLTFTMNVAEAGEVTVDVSTIEGYANWSPVYDMRLTTGDTPTLDMDRSVVVSQQTGQDWLGVNLILSTARPGEQIAPSQVSGFPSRIISQEELDKEMLGRPPVFNDLSASMAPQPEMMMTPSIVSEKTRAIADFSGATVTYIYPGTVDIRNGVEDLRLPLDTLNLDAEVWAEAVPSRDSIAYRVADFTNTTQEVLLPGQALMFTDGTMVGFTQLPLIAAGADTELGFGPLDGVRLTRVVPNRSTGDAGVFTSDNQLVEAAVIGVENLTSQEWKVVVRDAVTYSQQDDLEIEFDGSPAMTRVDPEGRRGILEWDLNLPAGQKQEITLNTTLTWPSGYVLQ